MEEEERIPGKDERQEIRRGKKGRKTFRGKGRAPRSGNDFTYWNKYPELMDAATKIPWMYIPGTNIKIPESTHTAKFFNVMTIDYVSTIGINTVSTDPFNLQIRKTWLDMHRKYRGLGSYEQADLGIILFCVKEIFSGLGECARIYGIYSSYPVSNRILPRGILSAMGYGSALLDSIEDNLADYLYGINRLVRKARQLCLPKNLSVLRNQLGLTSFLYCDSKDRRASIYAFKPAGYWRYEPTALSTGSAARHVELNRASSLYNTYQKFLGFFETLIDILLNDSDVTRVCSDLIAAYGEEGTEALVPFESGHSVSPIYDESILQKIHNCENVGLNASNHVLMPRLPIGGDPLNSLAKQANTARAYTFSEYTGNLWIAQADNVIVFKPVEIYIAGASTTFKEFDIGTGYSVFGRDKVVDFSGAHSGGVHPLDTWKDNPDAADVCESCLWKYVAKPNYLVDGTDESACFEFMSCSTELIVGINTFQVVNGTIGGSAAIPGGLYGTSIARNTVLGSCHFDWHPMIPLFNQQLGNQATQFRLMDDVVGDIDNFTMTTDDVISKIHDAALLSAFAIDATVSK